VGALALALLAGRPASELLDRKSRLRSPTAGLRRSTRALLARMVEPEPAGRAQDAAVLARRAQTLLAAVERPSQPRAKRILAPVAAAVAALLAWLPALLDGPPFPNAPAVVSPQPQTPDLRAFESHDLAALCAPLAKAFPDRDVDVSAPQPLEVMLAGHRLQCRAHLSGRRLCTFGCKAQWTDVEAKEIFSRGARIAADLASRHGPPTRENVGPPGTAAYRAWGWDSGHLLAGGRSLLVSAKHSDDLARLWGPMAGTRFGTIQVVYSGMVDVRGQP
jgi:hypothetical protein